MVLLILWNNTRYSESSLSLSPKHLPISINPKLPEFKHNRNSYHFHHKPEVVKIPFLQLEVEFIGNITPTSCSIVQRVCFFQVFCPPLFIRHIKQIITHEEIVWRMDVDIFYVLISFIFFQFFFQMCCTEIIYTYPHSSITHAIIHIVPSNEVN